MADVEEKKAEETTEQPKVEAPAPTQAPPPQIVVPEVTKTPQWHLSKEEWDASQDTLKKLAEMIPGIAGLGQALSPLVDAINEVNAEEVAPEKPKPFMKRKLWGN